jgi:ADP-heptose:LPS heptosyltransferase
MSLTTSRMKLPAILGALRNRSMMIDFKRPQKILLVKQSERLGNIVLLNAAISGLVNVMPDTKIDLMLPAAYADIMSANDRINHIIPALKREYILKPWKLAGLIRLIRHQHYDLAIDCSDVNSHSSTGALYTLLSGAKITAGWKTGDNRVFDIEVERYGNIVHASEMYLKLFSGILKREIVGEPYFNLKAKEAPKEPPIVGINCGGRGFKRWPLADFIKVGARLGSMGYNIEFILGPEEESLRADFNSPANCRLLPLLPLPKLMEAIRSYSLFISSDTGPMHLAWSLRVPTIAIFLDSELDKFKPLSPGSLAINAKDGVSADEVAEIAIKILKSTKVLA